MNLAEPPSTDWPWFIPLCESHQLDLGLFIDIKNQNVERLRHLPDTIREKAFPFRILSSRNSPFIDGQKVYFLQRSDGCIKIGMSSSVHVRKKSLESAAGPLELLLTLPGGYVLEHDLHEKFENDRVHGEWFNPSDELLNFIKDQLAACAPL